MAAEIQKIEVSELDVSSPETLTGDWLQRWWKLVEFKVGIVPLPVYILLLGIIAEDLDEPENIIDKEIDVMPAT